MMQVGPASQTLAAMRRLSHKNGQTFASVRVIADVACLPTRTVERHLGILDGSNWVECIGRKGRRTPTYFVTPEMVNRTNAKKFAILPRCVAKMLPTWAERAVFACIVSRDSLNEVIGDGEAGENFGRLQYPVKTISLDSGLSRRAIDTAKAKLHAAGLIHIDPAILWQDDRGRCKTLPDTLYLNANFPVSESLIDRGAKVADPKGIETLHRSANLADTTRKNGGCLGANLAGTGRKNGGCSELNLLNQFPKGISTSTAASAADGSAAGVVVADRGGKDGGGDGLAEFIRNVRSKLPAPAALEDAIDSAFKNGCTLDQLRQRAKWFNDNILEWKPEHRPGAIYNGFANAHPAMPASKGWPYQR